MLILTRKIGENIIIANNITIAVLSVKGTQVKLGIEAPRDIPVHREEIFAKIQTSVANTIQKEKSKSPEKDHSLDDE